jgi:hypothetical protein
MKIVDIQTGEKHIVKAYYKTSFQEIIETETWAGCHIVGIDCEFEADAKCECKESTGYMVEKVCNICGKVIN